MSSPNFVRPLSAGGVPTEPLMLDEGAQQRLSEALDDIEASRAAAMVSAQRYVVLDGGR